MGTIDRDDMHDKRISTTRCILIEISPVSRSRVRYQATSEVCSFQRAKSRFSLAKSVIHVLIGQCASTPRQPSTSLRSQLRTACTHLNNHATCSTKRSVRPSTSRTSRLCGRWPRSARSRRHPRSWPRPRSEQRELRRTFPPTSFYLCMTLIPATYLLWEFSRPNTDGSPNAYTRLIAKYSEYKDTWATRNALHTQMVEQAGRDRNLFLNTPQPNHIELRFPEQLNVGSPINVPAGHGSASMEKLVAHYREQQFKDNEEKLRKQRDGEL
ncbi:hypothetical protein FH972_024183 [Carpinus fangiana]|uniref:Uncharacterized protein n=1 Tax=Carpinus fangiana TaxID=176857 RepID=A0A5N6KXQ3_9ROSI|nr:hypothetical protein FH972_024183 [Carpinus fangiana]